MLLDITKFDNQRVFVCDCLECQRIIPIVEDDVTALDD